MLVTTVETATQAHAIQGSLEAAGYMFLSAKVVVLCPCKKSSSASTS